MLAPPTPRNSTAAAKPVRSPTTPPPNATSVVLRSGRRSSSSFISAPKPSNVLLFSPAGTMTVCVSAPAFLNDAARRAP